MIISEYRNLDWMSKFRCTKPPDTIDKTVWAFSGKKGQGPTKDYHLCALFYQNKTMYDNQNVSAMRIEGLKGHFFHPQTKVNDFEWFKYLMRQQANFSLGIDSDDTIFQGDEAIAHTTSALRYPIFVDRRIIQGINRIFQPTDNAGHD